MLIEHSPCYLRECHFLVCLSSMPYDFCSLSFDSLKFLNHSTSRCDDLARRTAIIRQKNRAMIEAVFCCMSHNVRTRIPDTTGSISRVDLLNPKRQQF